MENTWGLTRELIEYLYSCNMCAHPLVLSVKIKCELAVTVKKLKKKNNNKKEWNMSRPST